MRLPSGCSIDWRGAASKQGIRFAYAEATNGNESTAGIDKAFLGTWQALKPLHEEGLIYRGAFHWLSSNPLVSGISQAQWFLKNVNDGGAHLAHALDFEPDFVEVTEDTYDAIKNKTECKTKVPQGQTQTKYFCDGWYGQTADTIIAKIAEWIKVIEDNHQTAMIYTTESFWDKMIGAKGADILTARGVWLARYLDPKQFPTSGMPQSILSPVNKWGMPPLPKNVSYPTGATYSSRTNWQFEQCGEFRQTVWTCKGKPAAGPAPDKMACPTASGAVMDMNWYPSSLSDFKSAFGIN